MRQCDGCGYLLLGDGDTCNRCGAALPALSAAATAATPTATPTAMPARPTAVPPPGPARRPTPPPPPPLPRPVRPGPPIPDMGLPNAPAWDRWAPPAPTTPARTKNRSSVGLVLVVVLVSATLGFVGYTRFVAQPERVPEGTSDFAAGRGVTYTARDGSFSVQLPAQPRVETAPLTVNGMTATIFAASVTGADYELGAASITLPVSIDGNEVTEVLDQALRVGVASADGEMLGKRRFTRGGLPAIEATFEAPDGYRAKVLVVGAGERLYVLFAHAKQGTDALFRALDRSFIPGLSL
jgi:hypothetical protein